MYTSNGRDWHIPRNCGHLLRKMRMFQTLCFERWGQRLLLMFIHCRPSRLAVELDIPEAGRVMLAITRERAGSLRFDVCQGPQRRLSTYERASGEMLCVDGVGGCRVELAAHDLSPSVLDLDLGVPGLGALSIRFTCGCDRVRADIIADREIRIFPLHQQSA